MTYVGQQCPDCPVVDGVRPPPPPPDGVRRLFVLVPGALGYGWEWDAAVASLRRAHAPFVVFWWEPWRSMNRAAADLRDVLVSLAAQASPSLVEIVVVAHSAAGIIGAHALDGLALPAGRRVHLVTIGTPFAGMMTSPFLGDDDPLSSPALLSIGGVFRRYVPVPPCARVTEYVTTFPPDPVMQPRYGHRPAPPEVGPQPAAQVPVDPKLDHNFVVQFVVEKLLGGP